MYLRAAASNTTMYNVNLSAHLGSIDVSGNIMTLLDPTGNLRTIPSENCFYAFFSGWDTLVNAENLKLPATTLSNYCYGSLFSSCTSLVTIPKLPATTLAVYCYSRMFKGCTSLVNAPILSATTLADNCYWGMFKGCTSLVNAPRLPATTLAEWCYREMFEECTSLVKAPQILAQTVSSSLSCSRMFYNCSSLNNISVIFSSWPGSSGNTDWLYGVSSTGTFTCPPDLDITTRDASHIPVGWTVQNVRDGTSTASAYQLQVGTNNIRMYFKSYFPNDQSSNDGLLCAIFDITNPIVADIIANGNQGRYILDFPVPDNDHFLSGRFTFWDPTGQDNSQPLAAADCIVPSTLWNSIYGSYGTMTYSPLVDPNCQLHSAWNLGWSHDGYWEEGSDIPTGVNYSIYGTYYRDMNAAPYIDTYVDTVWVITDTQA